jgi:hypothetical protein
MSAGEATVATGAGALPYRHSSNRSPSRHVLSERVDTVVNPSERNVFAILLAVRLADIQATRRRHHCCHPLRQIPTRRDVRSLVNPLPRPSR